ncbi:MAG: hypothetical protein J5892_00070 [Bacilli bacterium]|nr:hypothetical protein [Bacilli bacterium]
MFKLIKNLLMIIIFIICLYLTTILNNQIIKRSTIYQDIIKYKSNYETPFIESTIIDNKYLIVGSIGKKVNVNKSYYQMKKLGFYHANFYSYDYQKPYLNKKYIILKFNPLLKSIVVISNYEVPFFTSVTTFESYPYQLNMIFINKYNYHSLKDEINYGNFIYLEDDLTFSEVIYLTNYWYQKGFKIIKLDDLQLN